MKEKFWKIIALTFIIWLFLYAWLNRNDVDLDGSILIKQDKVTGKIYVIRIHEIERHWTRVGK